MKIGLQLHTVRNELKDDWAGTMRFIADQGIEYIEGGLTFSDEQFAILNELGIKPASGGGPLPLEDEHKKHLDLAKERGFSRYVVFSPQNWAEDFKTIDNIKAYCALLKQGVANAKAAGLTLCYHNHWFEAELYDGMRGIDIMRNEVGDDLHFEIDTYWAAVGGADPAVLVRELGDKVPLIHIKDGPIGSNEDTMCPLGLGKLDIPAIVAAAQHAEYAFIELDNSDRNILESVKISAEYLRSII